MNALLVAVMLVEAIFGLGFILVPGALLSPMGVTLNATSDAFSRLFGTAIFSLAVLVWLARKSDSTPFKRGAVLTLFTYYVLSGGIFGIIILSGLMNVMGWSTVILHLGLAAWCGASLVTKRG